MNRQLGKTDYSLYPVGLGAMSLSIQGRPTTTEAIQVIQAFVENGGNFIDTANVYCLDDSDLGHNERLIHSALALIGKNDYVLIATKGGLRRPRGEWIVDAHPTWLRTSCEQSLRDLQRESIDLYYLHASDLKIPFEESLGALMQLQQEGKIRYIGISNVNLQQLTLALRLTSIAAVQNRCNPFFKKDFHNGLIRQCQTQGVSYVPYSPFGGRHNYAHLSSYPLFQKLSKKYNASPYQISLAWLLQKITISFLSPELAK